ncbi:hypothetical protein BT63DRAFT_452821 [Microthyrium microscopicum]|uniref:Kinetochore protein NDC80 loop region domain-containing protein n=1 Tax=Microthyrium microscopicum TaxID=703497 RepID=A0A6A6ULI6_9PEZI|nr:hypothetical protein BT63DRAFT_452821 [Microthyrium microscopicum]
MTSIKIGVGPHSPSIAFVLGVQITFDLSHKFFPSNSRYQHFYSWINTHRRINALFPLSGSVACTTLFSTFVQYNPSLLVVTLMINTPLHYLMFLVSPEAFGALDRKLFGEDVSVQKNMYLRELEKETKMLKEKVEVLKGKAKMSMEETSMMEMQIKKWEEETKMLRNTAPLSEELLRDLIERVRRVRERFGIAMEGV